MQGVRRHNDTLLPQRGFGDRVEDQLGLAGAGHGQEGHRVALRAIRKPASAGPGEFAPAQKARCGHRRALFGH